MQHCQRAGASNRTADELGEVFVRDTIDLVRETLKGIGHDFVREGIVNRLEADLDALVWDEVAYCRWLNETPEDQSEILQDLIRDAEGLLGDIGLSFEWDDGYIIADASDWDDDGNYIGDAS